MKGSKAQPKPATTATPTATRPAVNGAEAATPTGPKTDRVYRNYLTAKAGKVEAGEVDSVDLRSCTEATLAAVEAFHRGDEHCYRQIVEVLEACEQPGRYLLYFEKVEGGRVYAAVACGNPAAATNRAVMVPGIESGAEHMGRLAGAADGLRRLADAQRLADGRQGSTSVTVWVGYRAPTLADSFNREGSPASYTPARDGAGRLARFCRRWMPDGEGVLVGHSYGSLVAASAANTDGGPGDNPVCARLVAAGSPGFGYDHTPDGLEVYVAEADADPVAGLGWFGPDPGTLPNAYTLHTGKSDKADAAWGHTQYFVEGTTSQWNIAAVVGGNQGSIIVEPPKTRMGRIGQSAVHPLKTVVGALARRYHPPDPSTV